MWRPKMEERRNEIIMMTLRQLATEPPTIPTRTSWYLADLAEARGKQELYTRQSPQKLKVLREHALIESAVSSNRIEGVEVDQSRIATLIFGKPALRDRDEEEVRGYRDALTVIHESGAKLPISEATIQRLHKLCRGQTWDAGAYKEKDVDIIQKYANGRSRVRFKTVLAKQAWKWADTSASNGSSSRTRSVTTKCSNRVPSAGTKGGMTLGPH